MINRRRRRVWVPQVAVNQLSANTAGPVVALIDLDWSESVGRTGTTFDREPPAAVRFPALVPWLNGKLAYRAHPPLVMHVAHFLRDDAANAAIENALVASVRVPVVLVLARFRAQPTCTNGLEFLLAGHTDEGGSRPTW